MGWRAKYQNENILIGEVNVDRDDNGGLFIYEFVRILM